MPGSQLLTARSHYTALLARCREALSHPVLRRLYALVWVALITVLLLQSSENPLLGPAAPPGDPPLWREVLLAVGHVVAFSGLVALLWWALVVNASFRRALTIALVISLALGLVTEMGQALVPDRSALVVDLIVNWLSSINAALLLLLWRCRAGK
jgi:VanZ family protein